MSHKVHRPRMVGQQSRLPAVAIATASCLRRLPRSVSNKPLSVAQRGSVGLTPSLAAQSAAPPFLTNLLRVPIGHERLAYEPHVRTPARHNLYKITPRCYVSCALVAHESTLSAHDDFGIRKKNPD